MINPTILITMDYEMPGNGVGDIYESIIEPTDRLLDLLNQRKIKMTVFFEIEEFLAFKNNAAKLMERLNIDPAGMMEEQLGKMVLSGHEIGLHVHPQWIDSSYDKGSFKLSPEKKCLFDVYKNELELEAYLRDRTATLKSLVRKYSPSYEVKSFRAGGLALRPESLTLNVMRSLGIKADSSVVAGLYRVGEGINVDYRDAPNNKGFWYISDEVCNAVPCGDILEFPIYSILKPEYKKITFNRVKMKFFSSGNPVSSLSQGFSEMAISRTPWGIIQQMFKRTPLKFDYCHMNYGEMLSFFHDAIKENGSDKKFPLTLIGHSKEFFNDEAFCMFLDYIIEDDKARFMTMEEAITTIEESAS